MRPHRIAIFARSPWGRFPALNERLKYLWEQTPMSATRISLEDDFAAAGVSREAIIGRAHRLGLIRHEEASRGNNGRKTRTKNFNFARHVSPPRERVIMVKKEHQLEQAELAQRHLAQCTPAGIFELKDHGCRFVVDGDRNTFLFCNTLVPDHTGPIGHWCYCEYHRTRMFRGAGVE